MTVREWKYLNIVCSIAAIGSIIIYFINKEKQFDHVPPQVHITRKDVNKAQTSIPYRVDTRSVGMIGQYGNRLIRYIP